MKVLVRETVTHFHEVEMSDELDVEQIIDTANDARNQFNTGYEAIDAVLRAYKNRYGEAFDYNVEPNFCGPKCEEIEYETTLEE